MENYEQLVNQALALGFDAIGIAPAYELPEATGRLKKWLDNGFHAGMHYMARNIEKRENPRLLVENARSVIVTLTNYYTPSKQPQDVPKIARYAYGKDYHIVIKERLRRLMQGIDGRCFVDSAPLLEREWARRAGLGWIGKNTTLINKTLGSFCFIGIIITPLEFDRYSTPVENTHCGTCDRCQAACPVNALSDDGVDSNKCLSYHTIENKGDYPEHLRQKAANRIFGCDACLEACPWNSKAHDHHIIEFMPQKAAMTLSATDWYNMDNNTFESIFKDTPLERTGLQRLKRNL